MLVDYSSEWIARQAEPADRGVTSFLASLLSRVEVLRGALCKKGKEGWKGRSRRIGSFSA